MQLIQQVAEPFYGLILCHIYWRKLFLFQIAFWINREGIPGRACLSITTVLSLITLIGSTNAKLPNVSAVKALDVYFFICFGYVFGGLIEFATVIYLSSKEKKIAAQLKEKRERQKEYLSSINSIRNMSLLQDLDPLITATQVLKDSLGPCPPSSSSRFHKPLTATLSANTDMGPNAIRNPQVTAIVGEASVAPPKMSKWTASRIEVYSRIWFPTSFVTLFTLYWLYYYVIKADYYLEPK